MADTKTVGAFSITNGTLSGPKEYMDAKGNAKLDEILAGNSAVFNAGLQLDPRADIEGLLLVALQTDYAGWKGTRELLSTLQ